MKKEERKVEFLDFFGPFQCYHSKILHGINMYMCREAHIYIYIAR